MPQKEEQSMKKFFILHSLFLLVLTFTTNTVPPLMSDLPFERSYDETRLPQFLTTIYSSIKETVSEFHATLSSMPENIYNSLFPKTSSQNQVARLRYCPNDELCQQEQQYVSKRLASVQKYLEQTFDIKLDENKIPKIACCFSGGGFRSMITTFGFLNGAQRSGALDATLYLAGLSGSTWAIAPWIASGRSLTDYFQPLSNDLNDGIKQIMGLNRLKQLMKLFIHKMLYKQMVTSIDIYGSLLANTLLTHVSDNPLNLTISESHQSIMDGSLPMPIYTAIQSNIEPYEWLEFTPFEVGSSYLKSYIPTWAFGRKFKEGVSVNDAPEQTLGFCMGIFGSAFEISLKDVIRLTADNIAQVKSELPSFIYEPLKKCVLLIINSIIGDVRLFPAMLANFSYLHQESPIKDDKNMVLVDAGIDFNLPFPPLLRKTRSVDVIIVYDASASVSGAPELYLAEQYARRKGIKFPKINYETIDQKAVSIFKDEHDPETPIIIYFPRIKNTNYNPHFDPDFCVCEDYCNTFNFAYSKEQIEQLCGLAEFTVVNEHDVIQSTIKDVLVNKYGYQIATN